MLKQDGIILPFNQLETSKEEIQEIIEKIGKDKLRKKLIID